MQVIEFMEESDTFLPPVVRFKGIETVASINRLAAFTGVRFFRSCAIQCLAVTRDGSTCHNTPSTVRSVDIDPFRPESISLLIQIIEGHAPKRITLQQAFDIFAVFEYCLADCLFEMLPGYLEPLLERLNAHEVRHHLPMALLRAAPGARCQWFRKALQHHVARPCLDTSADLNCRRYLASKLALLACLHCGVGNGFFLHPLG